jgi:quinol monooxygenase YgiN
MPPVVGEVRRGSLTRAKAHRYHCAKRIRAGEEIFMHLLVRLSLGMMIAAATLSRSAYAQDNAVYLATYVEVTPNSVAVGADLLKRYRAASRNEDGNLRFDVLQEVARPNRFAIVESWRDKAALDAHAQAASTIQFRDKLKAIQNAPYDERVAHALYSGQGTPKNRSGAIYVLTHVDVLPAGKDDCMAALKAMSVESAKDAGNISYQALQQANRSNHFTVVEEWTSMKAVDAHAMAAHTRAFRAKLIPIAGALYDERFYRALG